MSLNEEHETQYHTSNGTCGAGVPFLMMSIDRHQQCCTVPGTSPGLVFDMVRLHAADLLFS